MNLAAQPERIRVVHRIPARKAVGVQPTREPDRVKLRELSRSRVVVTVPQKGQTRRVTPTTHDHNWTKKGKHTTRNAVLYELDFGGWVVDTPGIRQMELWDVHPEEIEGYFVEFRPFVRFCKFPNCSHVHESDCGVQSAVARGLISTMRYESYRKLTLGDGE